jgi:hypothetical protein
MPYINSQGMYSALPASGTFVLHSVHMLPVVAVGCQSSRLCLRSWCCAVPLQVHVSGALGTPLKLQLTDAERRTAGASQTGANLGGTYQCIT